MMKYYIGYYNKPWDKSEFTVIAGSPDPFVALFILDSLFWFSVDSVEPLHPLDFAALPTDTADSLKRISRRTFNQLPFPDIKRVIYSGPKTIILWTDGTKTIVSCGEGESYDHYTGFCAAVTKKLFGSTSHAKKVLGRVIHVD